MQLSNVIGKRILSPAGEKLGYVLNVFLTRDLKKISSLHCADENEDEYYLSARSVLSYGDAIIAGRSRLDAPTGILSPLGGAVYSYAGESLGAVSELNTENEPVFAVYYEGQERTYPLSRISMGETLIVYPEGVRKPPRIRKQAEISATEKPPVKPKPVIPTVAETRRELPVQPAPQPAPAEAIPPSAYPTQRPKAVNSNTGTEISLNRLNLIGRRIKKSVYDLNGNPIALAGERITPDIVSAARRNNRLLQLTVNTLTNIE